MGLKEYIVVRACLTPVMIFILLSLIFIVVRVLPGDPVRAAVGPKLPETYVEMIRHELGLDKPLWQQYIEWFWNLLHGDFGKSIITRRPFADELWSRFKATIELAVAGMIVAIPLGIALGYIGAVNEGSAADHASRVIGVASYAIPVFWLGIMLQLVFGIYLHWLPVTGRPSPVITSEVPTITGFLSIDSIITGHFDVFLELVRHLILPAVTLGFVIAGIINRVTRNSMIEALRSDYVLAAKSRGIPSRRVNLRYGLRNALIPVVTVMGLQMALLMGGAVLTETVFNYPGLGTYLKDAILSKDYTVIQAIVALYAIAVAVINFAVDIVYAFLDPRIRY